MTLRARLARLEQRLPDPAVPRQLSHSDAIVRVAHLLARLHAGDVQLRRALGWQVPGSDRPVRGER